MDATTSTEPYVISNWPAAEQMLEDDEDFELLSRSSLQTPSFLNTPSSSLLAAAINDQEAAQDNLLDALSRLEEERSRSVLLQRQVEVARALASLPTSEVPARAATIVAAHWRARAVRIPAARAIADRRNREALAAAKLQTELRAYLTTTLPSTSKSALRREIVRMHGARATDVTSLARKERQIDSMVERQIETFNAHKVANEASATREATLSQALHESERKVRELRIALETTMEGAKEAVQQQQAQQHSVGEAVAMAAQEDSAAASCSSDDGSRITSLEALATGLAVDKADLAYALEEMKVEKRKLEERLSEVTLQKDEAEDRASALLAEKLQKESASDGTFVGGAAAHHRQTRGSGSSGGGPLEWPLAAAAAAAVPPLFGCGSEEDLERGGGSWLGASTSSRRSATPPVDLEQPTTPASASMQRSF